jgi:hypothetical protein
MIEGIDLSGVTLTPWYLTNVVAIAGLFVLNLGRQRRRSDRNQVKNPE